MKKKDTARDLAAKNAGLANKELRAAKASGDTKRLKRARNAAAVQVETLRSKTKGWHR